jgi:hypothetical protein
MQRDDVRMLEIRRRLDLGEKPLGAEGRGEFGVEDLERDLAIVTDVAREIHGRHAAVADLPLDFVAVGNCGS